MEIATDQRSDYTRRKNFCDTELSGQLIKY